MSQEWPRPVPQHVEWAPATPTTTAGEKRKTLTKPAQEGLRAEDVGRS